MIKRILLALILSMILTFSLAGTALANTATTWELNPDTNAEVSIDENTDTITLGVAGRTEGDSQPMAVHGASIELPPAQQIYVEFNYDLYTWDSYNAVGTPSPGGTGYWDSFSISVSQNQYWNLALSDPLNGDPLDIGYGPWGGVGYGDGTLETASGSSSATMSASTTSTNYLNVVLDTLTAPEHNGSYASWGTIEITKIEITGSPDIEKRLDDAWEAVYDDGILDLGEKWYFVLEITVTNNTPLPITDVMVKDNLGGDLELNDWILSTGTLNSWTTGKTEKVHLTWTGIGTLASGQQETLLLLVSTDMNTGNGNGKNQKFPNGHQEYTSEGEHCLNSGATAKGLVALGSGVWEVSDTTDEICVETGTDPM